MEDGAGDAEGAGGKGRVNLARLPLFERLAGRRSILLAGAGGGFDVHAALPLYAALRAEPVAGRRVHLANLSFTHLDDCPGRRPSPTVVEITPATESTRGYFPEKHLAQFLHERGAEPARVFAFHKTGVAPLRAAYEALVAELAVDAVVLVDGGTDSLLCGDEAGLGTPVEDMASIAAVNGLAVAEKLLVSVGFGIDSFHGVSHAQVLEGIAALVRAGGYLGAFSLLREMPEFELYRDALEFTHARMREHPSIVNGSIVAAVEGAFGDVHFTERTRGSELFLNPLMGLYFAFELGAVAERVGYLGLIGQTTTAFEISTVIEAWQRARTLRPGRLIPH